MADTKVITTFKNGAGTGVVHFQLNEAREWHLMLGDDPAYLAAYAMCDTCRYVFTKVMPGQFLSEAVPAGAYQRISEQLSNVASMPSNEVLQAIGSIIPGGDYSVVLAQFKPLLVVPGGEDDYFSEEAVATWGLDPYFGIGHCPETPYYRLARHDLGSVPYGGRHLGVVLGVPLFPPTLMRQTAAVETYRAILRSGSASPTALAIGLVDDRGPATWLDPPPNYSRHLIVSLFVLDGHHKLLAAANEGCAIQILSFFPRSIKGLADPSDVDHAIELLSLLES